MTSRHRPTDERGETLLEMLLAIAILGVVVVGLMAGLTTSVLMSDVHRKQSTAGAYVRDFAEAVEKSVAAGYHGCGDPFDYTTVSMPTLPTGYQRSVVSSSCAFGANVRQLVLQVNSTDGRASERLVVFVRKSCSVVGSC
jgi:prepilin-type N-terminal cleavage/methylation domain-containing protein